MRKIIRSELAALRDAGIVVYRSERECFVRHWQMEVAYVSWMDKVELRSRVRIS